MRIQLSIEHLPGLKIPLNYQYLISSWIYKTIYDTDKEFAKWLHEEGYTLKGKKYKHFCFSMLMPKRYAIHNKESLFELVDGPTQLTLSFNIDKALKGIIRSLFQNNTFQLKSGSFNILGLVNNVQLLAPPTFEESMYFRAITPICISKGSDVKEPSSYLSPDDNHFGPAVIRNLVDKANAYLEEVKYKVEQVGFKLISENYASKLWTIKGISIKGYLFDFELQAPVELMEIGYYAGFGTQNSSLGMGMTKII